MEPVIISNGKITREGKRVKSILPLLNKEVGFDKELTVYGFIKALKPFINEVNAVFTSHLGGTDFNLFLKEAAKKTVSDYFTDDIDYCEVHWATDYAKTKKYEAFYEWPNFHGCKKGKLMTYGLDFSPINSYKDKPLILNNKFEIRLGKDVLIKTKKRFLFFEAVGCVLDDISFYGPPDNRDSTLKKLEYDDDDLKTIMTKK